MRGLPAAILSALETAPEGMTDGQIATLLGKNHSHVHQTCERLAAGGLIKRERSYRPMRNFAASSGASTMAVKDVTSADPKVRPAIPHAADPGECVRSYLVSRRPDARYASFDYCFNYFQEFRDAGCVADLASSGQRQDSCLQLAFYLASWGMLRGSSELLQRSLRHYIAVIETLAEAPMAIWDLDVSKYDAAGLDLIFEVRGAIGRALPEAASPILATKIMLGVFGCVPAFDTYFKKGLGVSGFTRAALNSVHRFYVENAGVVEEGRVNTYEFDSGEVGARRYSQAKVIDMIFFTHGERLLRSSGAAT